MIFGNNKPTSIPQAILVPAEKENLERTITIIFNITVINLDQVNTNIGAHASKRLRITKS